MKLPGIGSHHSARSATDEWLTPPHVTAALGAFDLDPCTTPDNWMGARRFYTAVDDGLYQPWAGRVWLNPPYSEVERWIARLSSHGDGIALVFARCETRWWFDSIWPTASAILFLRGRLTFHYADGSRPRANSGGPSCLVAYGARNAATLRDSGLVGAFVALRDTP